MATVAMGTGQFQRFLSCDLGARLHNFQLRVSETCDSGAILPGFESQLWP